MTHLQALLSLCLKMFLIRNEVMNVIAVEEEISCKI